MSIDLRDAQVIFVLGGPCSGKGFVCSKAAQELKDTDHICMGDLLRAERDKPDSEWAEEIENCMREGGLVSAQLSIRILGSHIQKAMMKGRKKFILDGFPRSIDQHVAFEKMVAPCKAAVFLKCPKEVMVHRLLKRAKTSGRIDDHIEIFEKRYKGYLKDTVPIVKILKEDDVKVIEISTAEDGDQSLIAFKDALTDVFGTN